LLESRLRNVPSPGASIVVVDPGVGSDRHAIAIQTEQKGYLIGPDNGVLRQAAKTYGFKEARILNNPAFFNTHYSPVSQSVVKEQVSDIFHGRDIFVPGAAHLVSNSSAFSELGDSLSFEDLVKNEYDVHKVVNSPRLEAHGSITMVDLFGNVFTNIPTGVFGYDAGNLSVGILRTEDGKTGTVRRYDAPMVRSFAAVEEGNPLIIDDCYGNIHLAANMANLAYQNEVEGRDQTKDIKVGDSVVVYKKQ
jgi:S-adenosylmethionine hydrolase